VPRRPVWWVGRWAGRWAGGKIGTTKLRVFEVYLGATVLCCGLVGGRRLGARVRGTLRSARGIPWSFTLFPTRESQCKQTHHCTTDVGACSSPTKGGDGGARRRSLGGSQFHATLMVVVLRPALGPIMQWHVGIKTAEAAVVGMASDLRKADQVSPLPSNSPSRA
jgi:hypothetical protein